MAKFPSTQYTIRVAGVENTHTTVVGAIYLSGTSAGVHFVDQATPFEVSGPASIVSGMLRASNPAEHILVEVLCAEGATALERVTMARGRTILLGEKLVRDTTRFIRAAP
jgi:hypothetical protein